MSDYFYIELDLQNEATLEKIEAEAFAEFSCAGSQDFSVEEAKVDEILGQRSYSGGDLPREVLEEVENVLKLEGKEKKAFYFPNKATAENFLNYLEEHGFADKAKLVSAPSKDWNESWKESFSKIPITENFAVVPSWEKEQGGRDDIYIYPGMGFGTGNHETTFLCLKLMLEEIPESSLSSCLDFGCGSGILGIGFCQVYSGTKRADYLDIDQEALDNCAQNIDLNEKAKSVSGKLLLKGQEEELLEGYDLVFANILLDALLLESKTIVEKTKKYLIVSGLLKGQEEEVIAAYQKMNPSLKVVNVSYKNDWSAALLRSGE